MQYEDKIELFVEATGYDENFNPVANDGSWIDLDLCKIHGNSSSRKVSSADGEDFIYSYQVTMFTPHIIPKLNDRVRITKADGSIEKLVKQVRGSGTTKNKLSIFL